MEAMLWQVQLVVRNQAKSVAFFTEKVGFDKKMDFIAPGGNRYVTVSPKGESVDIVLWEVGSPADPTQTELKEHWAPGKNPPLVLRVSDVQKIYTELSAKGVEFLQPPKENPWGIVATFQDPDGNLFLLNQPRGG